MKVLLYFIFNAFSVQEYYKTTKYFPSFQIIKTLQKKPMGWKLTSSPDRAVPEHPANRAISTESKINIINFNDLADSITNNLR